jgi:hypothetical protein
MVAKNTQSIMKENTAIIQLLVNGGSAIAMWGYGIGLGRLIASYILFSFSPNRINFIPYYEETNTNFGGIYHEEIFVSGIHRDGISDQFIWVCY